MDPAPDRLKLVDQIFQLEPLVFVQELPDQDIHIVDGFLDQVSTDNISLFLIGLDRVLLQNQGLLL